MLLIVLSIYLFCLLKDFLMSNSCDFGVFSIAFETSRKEARICKQEFEEVKKRRYELFSRCFEHASIAIDRIYKKLCRNTSAQVCCVQGLSLKGLSGCFVTQNKAALLVSKDSLSPKDENYRNRLQKFRVREGIGNKPKYA